MKRVFVLSLLMLTAVLLQTTVFARLTLFGVAPDLVLLVVICSALLEGPMVGAASGFGGGLLRDLLLNAPKGMTALSFLVVGYAVGSVRPYVQSTGVIVPLAGIFSGSVLGTLLYDVVSVLLGRPTEPFGRLVVVAMMVAVYNSLIAPFVYPVVRKATVYRTEKVLRW